MFLYGAFPGADPGDGGGWGGYIHPPYSDYYRKMSIIACQPPLMVQYS